MCSVERHRYSSVSAFAGDRSVGCHPGFTYQADSGGLVRAHRAVVPDNLHQFNACLINCRKFRKIIRIVVVSEHIDDLSVGKRLAPG